VFTTLATDLQDLSVNVIRDISDLSSALHVKIYNDISAVIGGAGDALDTLRELELFVTDLSDATVTSLVSTVADLSGRETSHYNSLSTTIETNEATISTEVSDLSSLTFHTLSVEISDLSSDTSREVSSVISDLSSYTSSELSREISDLTSETARDISDLSSLTFHTLSVEISDLSSDTSREVSVVQSLVSYEITDLSSYTSSELSREISDLSSESMRDISDLSSLTFHTLSVEISDLSSDTSREVSVVQSLASYEISDLSSYTSSELSREISDLSSESVRDISDLSSLTFHTLSVEISDLSSDTSREISVVQSLVSYEINDLSSYTSSELLQEISDLSSETLRDISDMSDVFMTAFMNGGVAFFKYNDLSSTLHVNFSDLSSSIFEYADDVSYELYTEIAIRTNETNIIDLSINRIDAELSDLSNYTSSELTRQITDLSAYTSTEVTRQITDLSSYTSSELSREISDLSSETVRDISDLSSLTFHTLSVEISDLSSDTSREISAVISDLSSYTSSELSREISDLSSESVHDISDLSSLTFHTLSVEISDLSSDTSREISVVQSLTSYEITDLSSYTSSELSREIADHSSVVFQTLSIEISDLSSDTSREISVVQSLTSYEISDLSSYTSSELSREIADHSSVAFNTISIEISDLSSETSVNIVDLSSYTSSELSREISDLSSEAVRDISDLSAAVFTRIRVDISNILAGAPETLDTLKEIADVLGDPNDPSFNLATIINNIVDISANLRTETNRAISTEASLDTNISDLSSYTSSELSREISDLSSETVRDISDLSSLMFFTLSTEISDLSSDTSTEISSVISDLSSYTSNELTRQITDLSSYTSSELSREISDLSSETVRDISDLSSLMFFTLSTEISDLSSDTSTEISSVISDLSSYTSSELTRQITDLSDYTSSELSREISDLSSESVRDISDLSGYTSSELSREISDLSSESVRDISDLSSLVFHTFTSNVADNSATFATIDASFVTINNLLSTEISDLSSEVMRDISDLSSQVYQTIDDLPWEDTGSYLYTVNMSQKVGIGTSTPTSTLQVRSTDASGSSVMIQSRPASGTALAQLFLTDADESGGRMYNGLGVRFQQTKTHFDNYSTSTTSSQMMTFDHANSKIGINTTAPTADFEINGDLKINGALIDASGNSYASLNSAFVDTNNGVELELFSGATTTNRLYNDGGVLSFNGQAVAPTNLVFPQYDGSANQVMETDGSGNISWVTNHNIYITKNPNHDGYQGHGYTNSLKSFGSNSEGIFTYVKLGTKRYVYYTSNSTRNIRRYDMDTDNDVLVAGGTDTTYNNSPAPGQTDGFGTNVKFVMILALKYNDYDNYIYIGDNQLNADGYSFTPRLRRLNVYTQEVTTVVNDVTLSNYATSEGNQCPYNFAFDNSGNVYYGSQSYGYGVKKFNIQTLTQSGYIAPGEFTPANSDNYVFGVAFDNSSNGYLIHYHSMSKLTEVSGVDLSFNGYSNYFGSNSGGGLITYSTVGSDTFDVNNAVSTRLDTNGETQLKTDLITSLRTVTENPNAVFDNGVGVIATTHPNAQNFPRGYFTSATSNSATTNEYKLYWNESTTSTAVGMPVGAGASGHYGWGVEAISSEGGGGNVDGTGTAARVFYIQSVTKDSDVNSNAFYFGSATSGNRLIKVVPSTNDPDVGTVSTLVGKITDSGVQSNLMDISGYPTSNPGQVYAGVIKSVEFDHWGNILFFNLRANNVTNLHLMSYAGTPYIESGEQPILPGDSINTLSDISLNYVEYGEFLMWNGESVIPTQAPNGGRGSTIPNLNFTKSNIKDVSQNMFFNSNSKYLLLDKRITIDKIRINQKNDRALTIGYNVYIKEYYDNSGTLVNTQNKTISNAVVAPVTSGETYGSTIVDISATSFTNRNYLEVLIERSSGYVYTESNNTVARFNFFPYVNQYLNDVDISDNLNGGYNMSVKSINRVIEDGNTGCIVIGDSSDNYIRIPAENGASIDVKSVSFWIKNWTGGYILDGRKVLAHTQLTSNQYVEYGSANDISAGTGVSKFINQDSLPYESSGIGGDPSNNSIGLLHKDEWNFVYIEFNNYATFTSANPLLFGTSIFGDGGSYTIKDLRLHSDTILTNDIENLFNNYDSNDVMLELITTPVERTMNDLSDVSSINVVAGEYLAFDGTHYVPTNDVVDISTNLTDLSGHVYNMTITDLCDCIVTANSYFIGASTSKGNYTTAMGFEVMDLATDSGLEYNTAIGYRALYNTTSGNADRNTAIGAESLHSIGGGSNNTAIGNRAGYSHGSSNAVIIGYTAAENNSQSSGVAIGVGAVRNKTQSNGVFIGNDSGGGSTTGSGNRNVAIGSSNATGLTSGYDNVIIGSNSSNNMSTGYRNVIIGSNASSSASSTNSLPVGIYNAVGIGYESYPTASNTIRLGNTSHTNINTSATLTLGEITFPVTDGSQNTFLTTDGSGNLSFSDTSTLGEITFPTTDGSQNTFLITDGSGNLSFTNYEIQPHLSNVTFDGSNAIIVEFSRDIGYSANYNPSDFSVVHNGSSVAVLSVYELNTKLAINLGGSIVPGQPIVTPSYDLASQTSTLYSGSTSQYSHSSYYPDAQEGYNAFDAGTRNSNNIYVWSSITSVYNNNTLNGSYGGSVTTTVDGVSVAGEWIQVDVGQSVVVKTFKHLPSTSGDYGYVNSRQVRNAIFATSTDNSTWKQIGSVSFTSIPTTESTHTTSSNTVGRYFRYIVTNGHGNHNVQVKELTLLGVTEAQYNAENPPPVVDPSSVDVPIDLNMLKFVYNKSVDGSNNIVTTDGIRLKSFYYNGLGLTHSENPPHMSNVTFDGSNAIIVEFSRDISNSSNYSTSDFSVVHDGSSIPVLSVYEISNNLVLNLGDANGGGGGSSSGGSGNGGGLSSQLYYESFDNEDVTLESTHDTVYVTGRSGKALSTIGQSPSGLQWVQKVSDSSLPSNVRAVSFFIKLTTSHNYIFDNRDNGGGGDQRSLLFSATLGKLRFWNNSETEGTASGSGYLPTGTQPTIWYEGEQMIYGGDNRATHGADVMKSDGTVITRTIINDGNWHHLYIEYPGDQTLPDSFTWLSKNNHTNGPNGGNQEASIDDLRYFNAALSTSQITDLAAGNTGNVLVDPYDVASTGSILNGQTYSGYNGVNVNVNFDNTASSSWSNGFVTEGTTYDTNQTSTGYWMQVDIGQIIALKKYQIHNTGNTSFHSRNAKTWKLLYSDDGSTWSLASAVTDHTDWSVTSTLTAGAVMHEVELTEHKLGRYWRLSVEAVNGDSTYHQRELFLLGITEAEYNSVSNSTSSSAVDPYDLASSNSTLSGQTYTASSVHTSNAHPASGAFNGVLIENAPAWISHDTSYSSGSHNTSESTSGYAGEWIQVDIGQSVVAKNFAFYTRNVSNRDANDAKKMRLFSSTDGTNWTQVYDWTNLTTSDWRPSAGGTPLALTLDQNATGRYFRLVINELMGTGSFAQIAEFTINGILSSQVTSSSSSSSSSAVDVPIDLDKLKFTYTKTVDGSNNIVTTDGFRLDSFYYNGLGLTNLTNEEFSDLSDISLNATTLVNGHMIQYDGYYFTNIEPTIGDISFNGDLLPDVTNTRDIGSTSRKIKDIHVAGTIATAQLSVGTATYPNAYGNTNQFLRANNTGTLYWSHVYLNDLHDVNTASLANEHFLSYNSTSSSWLVSTLPNDNSANIVTLNSQVTDISNYTIALSAEISDLSSESVRDISDLSSLIFSTLSTEIYDLSQETINDIKDLSDALHSRIYHDISDVVAGAGPALDTLKELEDYVTGLSGNTVGGLITDIIDLSNGVPREFNDLSDVSTSAISTGKLIKWDGSYFTETQLLYDEAGTGYIGIGTNSPTYPLTVNSYTTATVSNAGYLDQSGVALKQQTNAEISIYASKGIWTGTSFFASSDMRIKKDIVDLVPSTCMELVRKLQGKKYGFVDHIKHGSKEVYGFIAQDVKTICPSAVTTQEEFIPDVFHAAEQITWSKVDKKWKLTIHDDNIQFRENSVVRFYVSDRKNSEIMKDVSNCKNEPNSFVFDKIYEDIFVYGHQIKDFLALDKEQLFTLHHGAIQNLDDAQHSIKDEVNDLKTENKQLKETIEGLQQQLIVIKSHLGIM